MKKLIAVFFCPAFFLVVSVGRASDLKQSKFTQVINDVKVISAADSSEKPAAINDIFKMPDFVRTGAGSRAELVAADKTITRVGANTIFSFDPANRTIDLQEGSLLFHSPKGKGGGVIRTSSATAAVLGTTLIVATTHSGGFKVIDLEGHVAIRFLNGLKQDLRPGQMTFVLPGGHPAPVITIRLDTLTKNSHLVQGFTEPLPSMPLIQQQVIEQVKQIDSGQAQDTGLLVGDDATSSTVEAVDPNSIVAGQTSAMPSAVTIDTPTLDPTFITHFSEPGGPTTAFVAPDNIPNLIIDTSTIDLSPYSSPSPSFEFVAPDTLTINNSVAFDGLPTDNTSFLSLIAGNRLVIAPGSTVEADVGTFSLFAGGQNGMTLSGVNILNHDPTGIIDLNAPASISILGGSSIQAQNSIGLSSQGDVTVTGASLVATNSVSIFSSNGNVTLNSPQLINSASLDITAGGSIAAIDNSGGGGSGHFQVGNVMLMAGDQIILQGHNSNPMPGPGPLIYQFTMNAANLVQIQDLDFGGYMAVNMTAHTINLTNVAFAGGSSVGLTSHFGVLAPNPNMGAASVPGDVNFINNVTYAGQPAQNHLVSSGPGITISGGAP
jgi:hypothetical protein